jgi:hypothetical protein
MNHQCMVDELCITENTNLVFDAGNYIQGVLRKICVQDLCFVYSTISYIQSSVISLTQAEY